jgi:hypothetical protein
MLKKIFFWIEELAYDDSIHFLKISKIEDSISSYSAE